MESELWRWLWTGLAVVLGLGEAFTVTFFLLPFAVGAGAAAVLAFAGVAVLWQWIAFFVLTGLSFLVVRQATAELDRRPQEAIGANRWRGTRGVVVAAIDPDDGGVVRIGGEEWSAVSDGIPLAAGRRIVVVEVRGTRLVVLPDV